MIFQEVPVSIKLELLERTGSFKISDVKLIRNILETS